MKSPTSLLKVVSIITEVVKHTNVYGAPAISLGFVCNTGL